MPLNNSLAYLPPQIHTSSFSSDGNPHSHTESSEFGSWSGDMDDTLAREALDSLFDDYIRADAYSPSSSSAGGAPCFIESVLEPCSPTWLFDFGTPEGPPTSGRPGSLRQIVDTDTVADGLFPWPPAACGVVQEIARDTREQHIAEDIPFISDILAPPTAACLGRDPSSLLEAVHPHPSTDVEEDRRRAASPVMFLTRLLSSFIIPFFCLLVPPCFPGSLHAFSKPLHPLLATEESRSLLS
ncbi:hypothetical protein BV20DRAFT_1112204 [Pilatotrama ljubarskyi]|nr:hypothetical protein BV20DRAFT_1112204 [Pilatotrama ljubarskyi]